MKEKKKKIKEKKSGEREKKKKRDSLYPGGRGLSHFEEDFLQVRKLYSSPVFFCACLCL